MAYVRYFAGKDSAVSATFKSLNARGFTVEYTLSDGTSGEAFIEFKKPLTKREEIRPVLEDMAKEAETALGLVSVRQVAIYRQELIFFPSQVH